MQALCGAELHWSPPNWELRNLGGRACFTCSCHRSVLGVPPRRAPSGAASGMPPGYVELARRLVAMARCRRLAGGFAYRRLFPGILLCCAKDLLFHATGTAHWRRIGRLTDCRACAIRTFAMQTLCPALCA